MRRKSNLPGFTAGIIMKNSLYQYDDNTEGSKRSDNSTIEPQALRPRGLRRPRMSIGGVGGGPGLVGHACAGACAAACIGACFWNPFGSACESCVDTCMDHCTS